jgi:hypothetical protein
MQTVFFAMAMSGSSRVGAQSAMANGGMHGLFHVWWRVAALLQ